MKIKIRYHVIMAFVAWLAAIPVVLLIQWMGQTLEGQFFPVALAKNVTIVEEDPQKSVLWGEMDKYRDCTFLSVEAYLVDTFGRRVLIPLNVRESVKLREPGADLPWGPWIVSIPLWQAQASLQIDTVHRCHWLYLTRTIFYDTTIRLSAPRV